MKKKLVWTLCLIVSLLCSVVVIYRIDAMEFNGLRVMSGEELARLTEDIGRVDRPQNADQLVWLDGHRIPYDRAANLFYVSQSTEGKEYAGTFRQAGDNCRIYLEQDDALKDKRAAIAQGHRFKLWFVTQDAYAVSELVFTGLPTVCISFEEGMLTGDYQKGSVVVLNPDDADVITMSIKESAMEVKSNLNSGTISFKLYKKQYDQERDLSLLGLGKQTSWKLYPVYDKDNALSREMVASYVWNCICRDSKLQKGMDYAEVIVNGEYKGLYYLAPKVGKGYLDLSEQDRVYECEEILEDGRKIYEVVGDEDTPDNRIMLEEYESLWQEGNEDFAQVDLENFIDYNLYLQAVCGIQNSMEEYCVVARTENGENRFSKMPGRSKFVLGLYPSRIGWQSVFAAENIIEDAEYVCMADKVDGLSARTAARWKELRSDALSTDKLLGIAYLCEQKLADSGYIIREEEPSAYGSYCDVLHDMIRERMDVLDGYYQ